MEGTEILNRVLTSKKDKKKKKMSAQGVSYRLMSKSSYLGSVLIYNEKFGAQKETGLAKLFFFNLFTC